MEWHDDDKEEGMGAAVVTGRVAFDTKRTNQGVLALAQDIVW